MQIPLSKDEMVHICTVLRDAIVLRKALLHDEPSCRESMRSLKKSQTILVKITVPAICQIYDEPSDMENNSRLN